MKKAGIWLERLLFPPAAVLIAVPAVSFSALVYIFMAGLGESMAAYIIYCMSAYSLTVITAAVIRSWGRIKKWAASLAPVRWAMSVPGLQTAMIAEFSEKSEEFRILMNSITGGVVYITVIITAVYMLLRVRRRSANE